MSLPRIYTDDELAVMWCKLNAGRHPVRDEWRFDSANIAGAMSLIVVLIGPSKCLKQWRKSQYVAPVSIERRKVAR